MTDAAPRITELGVGADGVAYVELRLAAGTAVEGRAVALHGPEDGAQTALVAVTAEMLAGSDAAFDHYLVPAPDLDRARGGVALIDGEAVVAFLSLGAALTATDGAAAGLTAEVVTTTALERPGLDGTAQLERSASGLWRESLEGTPGRLNFTDAEGRGLDLTIAAVTEPAAGATAAMTATLTRLGDVSQAAVFEVRIGDDFGFLGPDGRVAIDVAGLGYALPGADYDAYAVPAQVRFAAGQAMASFDVSVRGDALAEFEEAIFVAVQGGGLSSDHPGVVLDPSGPPPVAVRINEIAAGAAGFDPAGQVELRVTANAPVEDPATGADLYDLALYAADGTLIGTLNADDDDRELVARTDGVHDFYVLDAPMQPGRALALIRLSDGAVLDFVALGAAVTAVDGPAAGATATVVADAEGAPLDVGPSGAERATAQRLDDGSWRAQPFVDSLGFRTKAPQRTIEDETLTVSGEDQRNGRLYVDFDPATPGALTVEAARWTVEERLGVGVRGDGRLTLTGAATVAVGDPGYAVRTGLPGAEVGIDGGRGTVEVLEGSTLRIDAPGAYAGTRLFQGGYDTLRIGTDGGTGTVRVAEDGSRLIAAGDSARIRIGENGGSGALRVEDGGFVGTFDVVAGRRGGTGAVTVAGYGSELRLSGAYGGFGYVGETGYAGNLTIGRGEDDGSGGGQGALTVREGGLVRVENVDGATDGAGVRVGEREGGVGSVLVTGDGSALRIVQNGPAGDDADAVASLRIGRGGFGVVTVEAGGALALTGEGARVSVGGGRLVDRFDDQGAFTGREWTADARESLLVIRAGGAATIDGGAGDQARLTVGDAPGAQGRVVVAGYGSTLTVRGDAGGTGRYSVGDIDVGTDGGTGALVVEDEGRVVARELSVGANANTLGGLYAPAPGEGSAVVRGGGRIALQVDAGAAYQGLRIGQAAGGVGTVTVEGYGSAVDVSGGAARIMVGQAGTGTLAIRDEGRVTGFFGDVGRENGAVGVVTVSGYGATLRLSDAAGAFADTPGEAALLRFGRNAGSEGRLTVTDGGLVAVTNGAGSDRDLPMVVLARDYGARAVAQVGGDPDGDEARLVVALQGSSTDGYAPGAPLHYGARLILGDRGGEGSLTVGAAGVVSVLGEDAGIWVGSRSGEGGAAALSTLRIEDGGRVEALSDGDQAGGFVDVGRGAGARGAVIVTGVDSLLRATSDNVDDVRDIDPALPFQNGALVRLGREGEGALTVSAGGRVGIDGGDDRLPGLVIGEAGRGSALVTGLDSAIVVAGTDGGGFGLAGRIVVGGAAGGQGLLRIESGGLVRNAAGGTTTIGDAAGAAGAVEVVGEESRLEAGAALFVGAASGLGGGGPRPALGGAGRLTLTDGGVATARAATVGAGGLIEGDGVIAAAVTLAGGTLSPGLGGSAAGGSVATRVEFPVDFEIEGPSAAGEAPTPGALRIEGDLSADGAATVALHVERLDFEAADLIEVTGAVVIDAGALALTFGAGDLGAVGDQVELITGASVRLTNLSYARALTGLFGAVPEAGATSLAAMGLSDGVLVAAEGRRLTASALEALGDDAALLDFSGAAEAIDFTALNGVGAGTGGGTGGFLAFGVAAVFGSGAGDRIALQGTTAVSIVGGDGDDTLEGGAGADTLEGGAGADVIAPGLGADVIFLDAGADVIAGTLAELDGVHVADFGAEDRIAVRDASGAAVAATVRVREGRIEIFAGADTPGATMTTDSLYEGDQAGATDLAPPPAPVVSVAGAGFVSRTVTEGDDGTVAVAFRILRDGDLSGPVTVDWSVSGAGAAPADATDFAGGAPPSGTATIAAGAREATVTVQVAGDRDIEATEDFAFAVTAARDARGAAVAVAGAATRGRIVNDDLPFQVSIAGARAEAAEGDGPLTFTVSRSGDDLSGAVVVRYGVFSGPADPASDADVAGGLPQGGTVTIPDGARSATIAVGLVDDARVEPAETLRVTLLDWSLDGGAARTDFGAASAQGRILNDDAFVPPPPPGPEARAFGDPHLVTLDGVGYGFQAVGEFTLAVSPGSATPEIGAAPLEVQIRTAPQPGSDLVSVISAMATRLGSATLMIDAGGDAPLRMNGVPVALTREIGVLAVGDGQVFFDGRTYTVVYATGEQVRVTAEEGFLSLGLALEGGRTVAGLLGDGDGNAANDFRLRDGTQLAAPPDFATLYGAYADSWRVTDATSLFAYPVGQGTEDFTDRGFPRGAVTLADLPAEVRAAAEAAARAAGVEDPLLLEAAALDYALTGDPRFAAGAAAEGATPIRRVEAADAPPPPPAVGVSVAPEALAEGGEGAVAEALFTVWRIGDLSAPVTVDWALSGVDAADLAEGQALSGAVAFAAGQAAAEVAVLIAGDATPEADEVLRMTIAVDAQAFPDVAMAAASAAATILNDDLAAPAFSLAAATVAGPEGATLEIVVRRDGDASAEASVTLTVAGAGADAATAEDFAAGFGAQRLTFQPGETVRVVALTLAADAVADEAAEGFTVALADPEGATLGAEGTAAGTILSDAPPPFAGIALTSGGDRFVTADGGANLIDGGAGADVIAAGGGDDALFGGAGSDLLFGDAGEDVLVGGAGGDNLTGGAGSDLFAFSGSDFAGGLALDVVTDFTRGEDRLELSGWGVSDVAGLTVSALGADLLVRAPGSGGVILRGISGPLTAQDVAFADAARASGAPATPEAITLTAAADRLVASGSAPVSVSAGAGADVVAGGSGADALAGGAGSDLLIGGAGADTLTGGAGGDVLAGGAGADLFVFAAANAVVGSVAIDTVRDFAPGEDALRLEGFEGLSAFADLDLRAVGADTAVRLPTGDVILLRGVAVADLGEADVLFG